MNGNNPALALLAERLLFLPGAAGNIALWRPVSEGLDHPAARELMSWPGFGGAPPDPAVRGLDDLVERVVGAITAPIDILAQSMGGVIAIRAALRMPHLVRHLVLAATSGGLDVQGLGGAEWRPSFRQNYPHVPDWFERERDDLTGRLAEIRCPVLLLWGDADPVSPVAVGRKLAELLPRAELVVVAKGDHDLVGERAADVLPHISRHLRS